MCSLLWLLRYRFYLFWQHFGISLPPNCANYLSQTVNIHLYIVWFIYFSNYCPVHSSSMLCWKHPSLVCLWCFVISCPVSLSCLLNIVQWQATDYLLMQFHPNVPFIDLRFTLGSLHCILLVTATRWMFHLIFWSDATSKILVPDKVLDFVPMEELAGGWMIHPPHDKLKDKGGNCTSSYRDQALSWKYKMLSGLHKTWIGMLYKTQNSKLSSCGTSFGQ